MNIMQKITLRQMKMNKRRTVVTILGIMFAVALITALSTFSGSFMDMFQRVTMEQGGNWQVQYMGVSSNDFQKIKADSNTKNYAILQSRGVSKLENSETSKKFIQLNELNPSGFDQMSVHLLEGRLPENSSEIVISKNLMEDQPGQFQIGKTVPLDLGNRYYKDTPEDDEARADTALNAYTPYEEEYERFVPFEQKQVTIVGIVDAKVFEKSAAIYYAALSVLDENALPTNAAVDVFVQVKDFNESLFPRAETLFNSLDHAKEMGTNNELLMYMGVSSDNGLLMTLYLMEGIAIAIIVLGSIALIYNSFAISISERSVSFGMLSGFGATNRQKRLSVLFEAGILSCIGIPLGLGLGFAGMAVTFACISPMFATAFGMADVGIRLVIMPAAVVAAVVISLVTIFLSAWIPSRRAARITPIEAIRQSKDVKLSARKVKTSKLTRMLFGFEAEIASKNFKRNRKRYRITIVSLVLSLVLFMSAASFSHYLQMSYGMVKAEVNFDVGLDLVARGEMYPTYEEQKAAGQEILAKAMAIEGVEKRALYYTSDFKLIMKPSMLSDDVKRYQEESGYQMEQTSNGDTVLEVSLTGMDDAALRSYAKEVGVDFASLKDPKNPKAIFLNGVDYQNYHTFSKSSYLNAKAGDTLQISNEIENKPVTLEIGALTDKNPIGIPKQVSTLNSVTIFVSMDVFDEMMKRFPSYIEVGEEPEGSKQQIMDLRSQAVFKGPDHKAMAVELNKIAENGKKSGLYVNAWDFYDSAEQMRQLMTIMNVFIYGFVTLISLVAIANIFNTISTSIALRRKEFAMLRSVGMTPKGFRRMIHFESFLYGFKAMIYGIPLSFGIMGLIYLALGRNFDVPFSVPWIHLISAIVGIFVIVAISMIYSSARLKKENIIDALRNDNI